MRDQSAAAAGRVEAGNFSVRKARLALSTSFQHVPIAVESEWSVKGVQLDVGRLTTAHSTALPSLIALWNEPDVVEKDAYRVEAVSPRFLTDFSSHTLLYQ